MGRRLTVGLAVVEKGGSFTLVGECVAVRVDWEAIIAGGGATSSVEPKIYLVGRLTAASSRMIIQKREGAV